MKLSRLIFLYLSMLIIFPIQSEIEEDKTLKKEIKNTSRETSNEEEERLYKHSIHNYKSSRSNKAL